ncbi:c15.1 [Ichnoviriform fugitivi]|uniref:C15.1 n=1 Tax=Ichnoviriform fugitivi TaxID=265522 RepID=A2Q0H9_9VIRU|nr:c15.1 [Ichnoviriform fugitivi]BAF45694.1 c15.1 [Ichnoviriform fugitivi]
MIQLLKKLYSMCKCTRVKMQGYFLQSAINDYFKCIFNFSITPYYSYSPSVDGCQDCMASRCAKFRPSGRFDVNKITVLCYYFYLKSRKKHSLRHYKTNFDSR